MGVEPIFFATTAELRAWLTEHHETATELLVGYYRKATGRPTISWPEAVDQALCFGWIDGVRRGIDEASYCIRFTPRKPGSIWSAVNIAKVADLTDRGLMRPAGTRAFGARTEKKAQIYSYEQRADATLEPVQEQRFRDHPAAWQWFCQQPPGYRRTSIYWVVSAKRPETRARRLDQLIEASATGRRI